MSLNGLLSVRLPNAKTCGRPRWHDDQYLVLRARGVYRGGSGRNLRPVWLKGGKNSTLKGGRIPPDIWVILMIVL